MDHREMYARLGQVITRELYQRISGMTELPAPGGQTFALRIVNEPYIYYGAWTFTFDVEFPNDEGSLMFGVSQCGSGFDPARVTLPLPPKDFDDDSLNEFPPEHQDAFYKLVDDVECELVKRGFAHDSSRDFLINQDYYPSTAVSVSVMNPQTLSRGLAHELQLRLQSLPYFFSIILAVIRADEGEDHYEDRLLIRKDRIVEDWNATELRREFGDRFTW